MIRRLEPDHKLLCTTRKYEEANALASLRKLKLKTVGQHGGRDNFAKLYASAKRIQELAPLVKKFSPDLAISFCTPEASRISFGLGIDHIAFSNTPTAHAVLKLSIPLVQKLIIPKHISKNKFTRYGILAKNIIPYNGLDECLIINTEPSNSRALKLSLPKPKTVLIRVYESQAAYAPDQDITDMLSILARGLSQYNILVLGRNTKEIRSLKKSLAGYAIVLDRAVDNAWLFKKCDLMIGSGGTMTIEAALRGIPTISYGIVPNVGEQYMLSQGLIKLSRDPKQIIKLAHKMLNSDNSALVKRSKDMMNQMEDPFSKLAELVSEKSLSLKHGKTRAWC